jgi:hypothetical protein
VHLVDKALCASPALAGQETAVQRTLERSRRLCPRSARLLDATQVFWRRELMACHNIDPAGGAIETCIGERLRERQQQLQELPPACDFRRIAHAPRYVDPWYVLRFGDLYAGRAIKVHGGMQLDDCESGAASLAGHLEGQRPGERLRVRFVSLPPEQREFLCAKRPSTHWSGTVERDASGPYLYLTDILGQPLPAHP